MKICQYLFLMCLLVLGGCREDIEEFVPNKTPNTGLRFVSTTISGQITDDADLPVEEAVVTLATQDGTVSYTTDQFGLYRFVNVPVREDGAVIKVEKPGYFLGSKTLFINQGTTEKANIKLLSQTIVGEFEASVGGEIDTDDDFKIVFSPNSIQVGNGNNYNGIVRVAARWLDPTNADVFREMPGNLIGEDANGLSFVLASAGMAAIDLFSPQNEPLNIKSGTTATLHFPIPNAIINGVPATIPLWHFDENNGIWQLEGEAQFVDSYYVAEVSHFSFWNCDALFPVVKLEGKIVDAQGTPISGTLVKISLNNGMPTRSGWTNENGDFEGQIPQNESLELQVFDDCGNPIQASISIGPFSTDSDIGEITLSNTTVTEWNGTVIDCDNNNVTNGYAVLENESHAVYLPLDDEGGFNSTVLACNTDELLFTGIDLTTGTVSDPVAVANTGGMIEVGTLTACNDLDEFLFLTIGSSEYEFLDPVDLNGNYTAGDGITLLDATQGFSLFAEAPNVSLGVGYPVAFMMLDGLGTISEYNLEVTLSSFGNPGEAMEGTIDGFLTIDGMVESVSGNFKIIREF